MEKKSPKKIVTSEQAYLKIRHYCAFQERTHGEVKTKLFGWGVGWTEANQMVATLIEEGFLNEERFSRAFTGGKFRMKGWGKKKIEAALKKKGVSSYCIQTALRDEIDNAEYEMKLLKLMKKKWTSLSGRGITSYVKQAKTRHYFLSRGFEQAVISKMIKTIIALENE